MSNAYFSVDANTTNADAKLEKVLQKAMQVDNAINVVKSKVNQAYTDGTRLLNVLLSNMRENQVAMQVQAAQQVLQVVVSLATTASMIAVAKASGNWLGVAALSASSISLAGNLVAAQFAQMEVTRHTRELERLNLVREAFR